MPRRPVYLKKSAKSQVEKLERKCRYCDTHQSSRRFDKHEAWCKKNWIIRKELANLQKHSITNIQPVTLPEVMPPSHVPPAYEANKEFVEGSSAMPMEVDYPTSGLNLGEPADLIRDEFGPHLPREYIKIVPHPHSPSRTTIIVPLNNSTPQVESPAYMPQPEPYPWAPFENLADFEYTETAILGLLPKWIVNKQLAGLNSTWAKESNLTIKNFTEMENVLSKARKYFVQFKSDIVTATYLGKVNEFAFKYQDPWEWILSIIQDASLAPMAMWNAVRKYYCSGNFEEHIYDEPNTADTWWDIDVSPHKSSPLVMC
ncbi:hypothetical protein B0H34DRAFT_825948 [Crassisporium funariophilum]|nr:hypothetical protein B0H34DRAFT_825948 [Crassisporium funariophilum]